jgi:hypothetical protein
MISFAMRFPPVLQPVMLSPMVSRCTDGACPHNQFCERYRQRGDDAISHFDTCRDDLAATEGEAYPELILAEGAEPPAELLHRGVGAPVVVISHEERSESTSLTASVPSSKSNQGSSPCGASTHKPWHGGQAGARPLDSAVDWPAYDPNPIGFP